MIHFEFPDSLETYYQEAGRGGRDGRPAYAVLLYRLEDKRIQSYFLSGRYPRLEELRAVLSALQAGDAGASSATLARMAEVSARRTQVLLHLLEEAGVVRRGSRGYRLAREIPGDGEMEELLTGYEQRGTSDRERLAEMMHFAETANCRVQILRAYFGEEGGSACGRCDNCARAGLVKDEAALELIGMTKQTAEMAAGSAEASKDREAVTTLATAYGEIRTTAPETIVHETPSAFAAGTTVTHERFGPGTVVDSLGEMELVDFVKGGRKKVLSAFLERAG